MPYTTFDNNSENRDVFYVIFHDLDILKTVAIQKVIYTTNSRVIVKCGVWPTQAATCF